MRGCLRQLFVQLRAIHETRERCAIIALLERDKSITAAIRRQASNRLTAVPEMSGAGDGDCGDSEDCV